MWRQIQKFLAAFVPALLVAIYFVVMACLLNRWDSMVPITLIPVWAWGLAGAAISLIGWIVFRGKAILYVFCLWLVSGIAFAEETHGIVRELAASFQAKPTNETEKKPGPATLRVVNFHAGGSTDSLSKLTDLKPDIVTVQQAPDQESLNAIAESLFGADNDVAINGDNAILARGEFLQTLSEPDSNTIHARLRTPKGNIVDITNCQLEPCLPNSEMWKPAMWRKLTSIRLKNRKLVRTYLGENEITSGRTGRLVCGGFSTPPGDDVFRPMESTGLIDSYDVAGLGFGNTFPGEYAIFRTDQIWVSENLSPVSVTTRLNPGSKHRTVVCDVKVLKN